MFIFLRYGYCLFLTTFYFYSILLPTFFKNACTFYFSDLENKRVTIAFKIFNLCLNK